MANGPIHSMKVFMSRWMIACDEASFLISMREDRKLGFREWWQLKMHLLTCYLCRRYARQIGEIRKSMEQYREGCKQNSCSHQLPPDAGTRINKQLDKKLNAK